MNRSQKIFFDPNSQNTDKYIKIRLEQDIDTVEFLSLSLTTEDIYQNFNADYGVIVGRVIANGGIGIPNAKISIFIPLDNTDSSNGEIVSVYPYITPRDKNSEGKRYNLLPRVGKVDPITNSISPKQPFGSFPIKEEVITNDLFLNVHKKYYKYTATTNDAGDYMIFGVPTGTQTVHMSVDITDIGKYSMNAASMVTNLGYSANLFYDNNSKIKPNNDLNDLPNIETQEISVDIIPFWGDATNFDIGITRQDFRIRSMLNNTVILFGSAFTDGNSSLWGDDINTSGKRIYELYRAIDDANATVGIFSKRIGKITEKIYYYPNNITDNQIDTDLVNPIYDMAILDPSEYSSYKRDGDFVFIINCNRNKIITDETGKQIPIDNSSPNGIFTKFRGFITLEITINDVPMNITSAFGANTEILPLRYKLKFPQSGATGVSFTNTEDVNTMAWRKQHHTFIGGNIYSFAKFHGTTYNATPSNDAQFPIKPEGFLNCDIINFNHGTDSFQNVGIIVTSDHTDSSTTPPTYYFNSKYQFPSNSIDQYNFSTFGANWMNLCIYLPQIGYVNKGYSSIYYIRVADNFAKQNNVYDSTNNPFFVFDNTQPIAGGDYNTKWLARSDLNWTDIIQVPKEDIYIMNNYLTKGFHNTGLTGTYRNGLTPCPYYGGKINANTNLAPDPLTYFYKGFEGADCIEYLVSLGIV